jgi:integrase
VRRVILRIAVPAAFRRHAQARVTGARWCLNRKRVNESACADPLYPAFVLALAMELRRGELGGLRWSDVDLDKRVLYVRQQTQRRRGSLYDDDPQSCRSRVVPMPALRTAALAPSRRGMAAPSSHGTSTGPARASRPMPGCGWSSCTTHGTVAPGC